MANIIGHFTRNPDGSFTGQIITLSVQAENVRIVPDTAGTDGLATHRVMIGAAQLGEGFPRSGVALRLALDDPSFAAAIEADLVEQRDGAFVLVWQR